MPKLQTFRQYHYDATSKVSENTRTLALAAIALVWLFKKEVEGVYSVPESLLFPVILIFAALALDFFQYVYRSIIWHIEFVKQEKKVFAKEITEEDEIYAGGCINLIGYFFFYGKILFLLAAYYKLFEYLFHAIKWIK